MKVLMRAQGSEMRPGGEVHKCACCSRTFQSGEELALFKSLASPRNKTTDESMRVRLLDPSGEYLPEAVDSSSIEILIAVCVPCMGADLGIAAPLTITAGRAT